MRGREEYGWRERERVDLEFSRWEEEKSMVEKRERERVDLESVDERKRRIWLERERERE